MRNLKDIYNKCSVSLLTESFGDKDTTGWVCIGEVPCWPWGGKGDKVYIMVNPTKILKYGKYDYDYVFTENNDGSGRQISGLPERELRFVYIYAQYQDNDLGEIFLGKKKDTDVIIQMHKEFYSKLFKLGNIVVLHHNSSDRFTDGVIRKGRQNFYSNNSDIGIYFWGSRHNGNDPSNEGQYIYYCTAQQTDIYDFDTNEDRISLDVALRKYRYAGQTWKNGDAIVVSTLYPTSIWCILDKMDGKWYDKNWNEIKKPF